MGTRGTTRKLSLVADIVMLRELDWDWVVTASSFCRFCARPSSIFVQVVEFLSALYLFESVA